MNMQRFSTSNFVAERVGNNDFEIAGREYQQVRFIPAEPIEVVRGYTYVPKQAKEERSATKESAVD